MTSEFDLLVQDFNSGMIVLDALKKALPPGANLERTVGEIGAGKLAVYAARRAMPEEKTRPAAPPSNLYDATADFAAIDKMMADTKAHRVAAQERQAEQDELRRRQRAADDRRQARVSAADTMAKADAALETGRLSKAQHNHLLAMTDAAWDAAAPGRPQSGQFPFGRSEAFAAGDTIHTGKPFFRSGHAGMTKPSRHRPAEIRRLWLRAGERLFTAGQVGVGWCRGQRIRTDGHRLGNVRASC